MRYYTNKHRIEIYKPKLNKKMKKTIIDLFENSVAKYGDNVCMWEKTDRNGKFEPTTYK